MLTVMFLSPGSLSASSIGSGVGNRPGNGGSNKNGMGGYPGSSISSDGGTRNPPVPTVELIKELGQNNVFWTSQQLDLLAPEDFRATVETFGSIPDLNSEQLATLKAKAVQVIMSTGPNSAHLGSRGRLVGLALNSLVLQDSHMFYSFWF